MKYSLAFAALAATVSAGTATVVSFCKDPVYLYAVDANRNPQTPDKVLHAGDSYTETYHTPASGGVSLKLTKTPNLVDGHYTQFEYTLTGATGTTPPFIWYDGSNVNCQGSNCPFYNDGIFMKTSSPSCPTRTCPLGQVCSGFYTLWNDDINTLSCDPTVDITMYLCSLDGLVASAVQGAGQAVAGVASAVLNPAVPSSTSTPVIKPVANEVQVPSAAPTATKPAAVYQMEALHVPAGTQHKHRRALLNRHAHMRRHAHAHMS